MKLTINKRIGADTMQIEIDEKTEKEALAKASFYLQPMYCGLCKGQNVILDSRKPKGFLYVMRKCLNPNCKATSTAGTYEDGSGLFWKQWEIFTGKDNVSENDLGMQ